MIYVNKKADMHEHANGTKVFVYPTKEDSKLLYDFVASSDVKGDLTQPWQYHCTVIYSSFPCPNAEFDTIRLPMTGSICGWEVFDSPNFGKCLVARIQSDDIVSLNKRLVDVHHATSNFPTYLPHITVAWKFEGEAPKDVPTFNITFDAYKIAGIDPNWTPNNLKK